MYLWNIKGLKQHIRQGELTERSRMIYFLLILLMIHGIYNASAFFPAPVITSADYAMTAFALAWIMGALYLSYRANNGNEGRDFLGRYMSISFVVGNRVMVWTMLLYFLYVIGEMIVLGIPEDEPPKIVIKSSVTVSLMFLAWNTLMLWRIIVHIKDVSGVTSLFRNQTQKVAP